MEQYTKVSLEPLLRWIESTLLAPTLVGFAMQTLPGPSPWARRLAVAHSSHRVLLWNTRNSKEDSPTFARDAILLSREPQDLKASVVVCPCLETTQWQVAGMIWWHPKGDM